MSHFKTSHRWTSPFLSHILSFVCLNSLQFLVCYFKAGINCSGPDYGNFEIESFCPNQNKTVNFTLPMLFSLKQISSLLGKSGFSLLSFCLYNKYALTNSTVLKILFIFRIEDIVWKFLWHFPSNCSTSFQYARRY